MHSIYTDGKFLFVSASPLHAPTLYEVKDGKPTVIAFDFKEGLYAALGDQPRLSGDRWKRQRQAPGKAGLQARTGG